MFASVRVSELKKQDGRNSRWQKVCHLRGCIFAIVCVSAYVCISLCFYSELEYPCISLCVRGYMFASVCFCTESIHFASVWVSQIECLVCISLYVSWERMDVFFSLIVSSETASFLQSVWDGTCLHQSVSIQRDFIFASVWESQIECLFASVCMSVKREFMFVSVWLSVQRECMFASVWVSELEYACISLCEKVQVCISVCLFRESAYLLQSECHRLCVCLHKSVCQLRESAYLFQSDCQFRETACLLQAEIVHVCFSLIVISERLHVCFSLSVTDWVSVSISLYVSWERVHICFSLIASSERVHVCFSLSVRVRMCLH